MNEQSKKELKEAFEALKKPVKKDEHLNPLYVHLKGCLKNENKKLAPSKVTSSSYTKNYDIVFSDEDGTHAIELKSISSSFGKNFNNRIEEMSGQALLSDGILKTKSLSYVFVVNELKETVAATYITRLKECAAFLIRRKYLKNFVLIRIKKSGFVYEENYSFENWKW